MFLTKQKLQLSIGYEGKKKEKLGFEIFPHVKPVLTGLMTTCFPPYLSAKQTFCNANWKWIDHLIFTTHLFLRYLDQKIMIKLMLRNNVKCAPVTRRTYITTTVVTSRRVMTSHISMYNVDGPLLIFKIIRKKVII